MILEPNVMTKELLKSETRQIATKICILISNTVTGTVFHVDPSYFKLILFVFVQ